MNEAQKEILYPNMENGMEVILDSLNELKFENSEPGKEEVMLTAIDEAPFYPPNVHRNSFSFNLPPARTSKHASGQNRKPKPRVKRKHANKRK